MSDSFQEKIPSKLVLKTNEVHVWLAFPDCCREPDLVATYLGWLDEQERTRYNKFKFPQHSHCYLVAHALLRNCLSLYKSVHPADLKFSKNKYGKPDLLEPGCSLPLRFSLSHTEGIVTCAVAWRRDIGIDAEFVQRKANIWSIAEISFTSEELAGLKRCAPAVQSHCFFQHWTLKEAYAKARGMGLYLPFDKLAFHLNPESENAINFTLPAGSEEACALESWRFALMGTASQHCIALAANSPEPLTASVMRSVPGMGYEAMFPPMLLSTGIEFHSQDGGGHD